MSKNKFFIGGEFVFSALNKASFLPRKNMCDGPLKNPPALYKIHVPADFTQQLTKAFQSKISSSPSIKSFKPTSAKNLASQQLFFEDFLAKYPDLKQQIEGAKNSQIILLSGLKVPELPEGSIPSSIYDSAKIYRCQEIKIAELVAGLMIDKFVPIEKSARAFNLLYPALEDKGQNNSFASDRELLWHNDGWASSPEGQVALFCVKGNSAVITEVITTKQIQDYFERNHKKHLLKALEDEFIISSGSEEPVQLRAKIIDGDKIRYAQYGSFKSSVAGKDKRELASQALVELNKCLENLVPSLSVALQNGDLLIIDNATSIHRRAIKKDMAPIQLGSRFLLRANVEDDRRQKDGASR